MPQKHLLRSNRKMSGYVVRKRKAKLTRKSVLKMLAVMEASQNNKPPPHSEDTTPPTPEAEESRPEDFLQSGRTGRRNALANILSEHAVVTSSDLPSQLEALTTKDKPEEDETQKDEAGGSEAGSSKS